MNFIYVTYHSYKIRYTVVEGMNMYLVSDLLDQYNELNHTNKTFEQYLEDKQTRELLSKKFHLPQDCSTKSYIDKRIKYINERNKNIRIINRYLDKTVKYITYTKENGTEGQDYVISEEFLNNCLMWVDPAFAWDICKFFKENNMKEWNSNQEWAHRLSREIRKLQKKLKDLREIVNAPDDDIDLSTDTLVI